jgi:hypothetical protein
VREKENRKKDQEHRGLGKKRKKRGVRKREVDTEQENERFGRRETEKEE